METINRGYFTFTEEKLENSPSRRCGIDAIRELSYRQQSANFIQDVGQRLQLSQTCINTAIFYMHKFYMFHSFTKQHRNKISTAALFLAAKVEEQTRKLEHVIKVAHVCLHKDSQSLDVRSKAYEERMNETVSHENILLQTLGFDLETEYAHMHVVKACKLFKVSKDLEQTSYIMATTSLHMTTMCLLYKPTVIACVCIYLACKWSSCVIKPSKGLNWFYYIDKSITWELMRKLSDELVSYIKKVPKELLEEFKKLLMESHPNELTQEYISILDKSPHRFNKNFGKDAASSYHGRSSITNNEPLQNLPSTSSDNRDSSTRKDSLSGSSFAGAPCDFGSDFDEKKMLKNERPSEKSFAAARGSSTQSSQKYPNPGPEAVSIKTEPNAEKVDTHVKSEPPKSKFPKYRLDFSVLDVYNSGIKAPSSSSQSNQKYPNPVPEPIELEEAVVAPLIKADPHVAKSKHPKHRINSQQHDGQSSVELVPQGKAKGPSPAKDIKTNGSKEDKAYKKVHVDSGIVSRRTPAIPRKHKRHEKHRKDSSHSSKDKQFINNHSEQYMKIKVKIPLDLKNLNHPESQKKPLKIKLPKPPMQESPLPLLPIVVKHETPASLKLVITKDKSGSDLYSSSFKNERKSRKRVHSSALEGGYKHSHSKYPKLDSTPKSHHAVD